MTTVVPTDRSGTADPLPADRTDALRRTLRRLEDELSASQKRLAEAVDARDAAVRRCDELAAALDRSQQELERFAHLAAHDLSQPLVTIAGFAHLLAERYDGVLDAEGGEFLTLIVDAAERMRELLRGLAAFCRATGGDRPVERIALNDVVGDVLADLTAAILTSDAVIEVGELPIVVGDRVQFRQVFQNLVTNALKFVAPGVRPRLAITTEVDGDDVRVVVADNGIGIAPAERDRAFEVFQRLAPDRYPGSGIGLAISKRIVEDHDGRIWVEDNPGGGTRVCFTLGSSAWAPAQASGLVRGRPDESTTAL